MHSASSPVWSRTCSECNLAYYHALEDVVALDYSDCACIMHYHALEAVLDYSEYAYVHCISIELITVTDKAIYVHVVAFSTL